MKKITLEDILIDAVIYGIGVPKVEWKTEQTLMPSHEEFIFLQNQNGKKEEHKIRILIIGSSGSIAAKHKVNLSLLGESNIYCYDKKLGNSLPEDISTYDLAIICTPPETHVDYIHLLNNSSCPYIMCEKPLCSLPTDFQIMEKQGFKMPARKLNSQVFINHAYRFEGGYKKLKELLPMVGEIRYANMENAYSFKKLHPTYKWEDYEGVIFDDSHLVNISRYLFGDPIEIKFKDVHRGMAIFLWKTNICKVIHNTNILNEIYKKRVEVVGEKGNLVFNYGSHHVYFCPADETDRIAIAYDHQSHLYEALKYVLEVVKNKGQFTENTIEDAVKDMEIIEELIS
jgi:predicted dehydrogenase